MPEQFGKLNDKQKDAIRFFAKTAKHYGDRSVSHIRTSIGGTTYQGMTSKRTYLDMEVGWVFSKEVEDKGYVKIEHSDKNTTIATLQNKGIWYALWLYLDENIKILTGGLPLWAKIIYVVGSIMLGTFSYWLSKLIDGLLTSP